MPLDYCRGGNCRLLLSFQLAGANKTTAIRALKLLAIYVPVWFSVLGLGSACAAPQECWELTQVSLIAGPVKILVAPSAVRIESKGNRYVVVCKAPDWTVVSYNPYSKKRFDSSLSRFRGDFAAGTNTFGGYLEKLPLGSAPKKKESILGQTVFAAHLVNPTAKRESGRPKAPNLHSVFFFFGDISTADHYTWDNRRIPDSAPIILNRMFRLPNSDGLALRLITRTVEQERHAELETTSLKKIAYNASNFVVPPNLVAVKSELEVVNDPRREGAVQNLIENWDEWGKIVDTRKPGGK